MKDKPDLTNLAKILLNRIQADFPLSPEPYAELAKELNVREEDVIDALRELKVSGVIRRIGVTLDSKKAGYVSILVGCRIRPEFLEHVASEINKHPGVTHSYERDSEFNLWFTLISPNNDLMNLALKQYETLDGVLELVSLPATKTYKIKVSLNVSDD